MIEAIMVMEEAEVPQEAPYGVRGLVLVSVKKTELSLLLMRIMKGHETDASTGKRNCRLEPAFSFGATPTRKKRKRRTNNKKEVISFPLLHPSRQRLLLILGWGQELRNVVCKETIPASQSRV